MPGKEAPMLARILLISSTLALAALPWSAKAEAGSSAFLTLKYREIGPAISGGRSTAVAGSDRDSRLYFAGGAGGGVFKTTDGGASWSRGFRPRAGRADRSDRNSASRRSRRLGWNRRIESTQRRRVGRRHLSFRLTAAGAGSTSASSAPRTSRASRSILAIVESSQSACLDAFRPTIRIAASTSRATAARIGCERSTSVPRAAFRPSCAFRIGPRRFLPASGSFGERPGGSTAAARSAASIAPTTTAQRGAS